MTDREAVANPGDGCFAALGIFRGDEFKTFLAHYRIETLCRLKRTDHILEVVNAGEFVTAVLVFMQLFEPLQSARNFNNGSTDFGCLTHHSSPHSITDRQSPLPLLRRSHSRPSLPRRRG